MTRTKTTPSPNQMPAQSEAYEWHLRRRDATLRKFNDMLGFWRVCDKPLCRRQRGCAADMHACLTRHWRPMPEEDKEYWRGCIKAASHTRSPEEIDRAGIAASEAYLQHKAKLDASTGAAAQATPAEPAGEASEAPTEPRIRRL